MRDPTKLSLAVVLVSWLVGLTVLAPLKQTALYGRHLSNLNFVCSDRLHAAIGLGRIKRMFMNTLFKRFNPKLKRRRQPGVDGL